MVIVVLVVEGFVVIKVLPIVFIFVCLFVLSYFVCLLMHLERFWRAFKWTWEASLEAPNGVQVTFRGQFDGPSVV